MSVIYERMHRNANEASADQALLALQEMMLNAVTNGALERIDRRVERGNSLRPWGVHLHGPVAGSPLAAADQTFLTTYPDAILSQTPVTDAAMYPVAAATEGLAAVGVLARERKNRQLFASAAMQLCRSAMEGSARTIWLLSDSSNQERGSRCLTLLAQELSEQKKFLGHQDAVLHAVATPPPPERFTELTDHRQKVDAFLAHLTTTYSPTNFKGFTKTVTRAATWIDGHQPAHDTGELASGPLTPAADTFYSYGSSFVHGLQWAIDYAKENRLYGMIGDGLFSALIMTECAIALFEALSRDPAAADTPHEDSRVPAYLEPTIQDWAQMYSKP
ncbi:hypothetical protein AB0H76_13465 [Nocardia sp. NPDC050712]|uniref:hypothetical protein n=1 Tax=Nocardia sp. NPDC050712 TaxID=3155518 RepID=UPI0033FBEA1A